MNIDAILQSMKHKLIVSVQAYPGEPLRNPETMALISLACEQGGAAAIRCQGLADISFIKGRVEIPVIGLWKIGHEGCFITPTLESALACANAGADIVAIDATDRERQDGRSFEETVAALRERGVQVMADCRNLADIERGFAAGCCIGGTTLSHAGAAIDQAAGQGPNLDLIREASAKFPDKPIICEGSVHSPQDAKNALEAGAFSVVVGTAITHPTSLTKWFVEGMEQAL